MADDFVVVEYLVDGEDVDQTARHFEAKRKGSHDVLEEETDA